MADGPSAGSEKVASELEHLLAKDLRPGLRSRKSNPAPEIMGPLKK